MKIVIKNIDGSVGIMHPIFDCGLTLEQIISKDVPQGIPYEIVEDDAIPQSRDFRNAWVLTDKIEVDITKAQAITKDRLRAERKPLLEALDVEVMKNITNAAALQEIEVEKQRLRDITLQVNNLITVEELKSIKCEKGV